MLSHDKERQGLVKVPVMRFQLVVKQADMTTDVSWPAQTFRREGLKKKGGHAYTTCVLAPKTALEHEWGPGENFLVLWPPKKTFSTCFDAHEENTYAWVLAPRRRTGCHVLCGHSSRLGGHFGNCLSSLKGTVVQVWH